MQKVHFSMATEHLIKLRVNRVPRGLTNYVNRIVRKVAFWQNYRAFDSQI